MVAADAHLDTGLLELLVRGAPECAVPQFRAAAAAARANSEGPSPAPARVELRALGYEALGHARVEPDRAPATLGQLRRVARELGIDAVEVDESCGRVFTELVAGGHYDAAEAARPYVTLPDGTVRDGVMIDRVRLDALFSVAMLALQRERATEAAAYFGLCRRLASLTDDPADRELADRARDHEVMALDQLTGADLDVPTPAPVPSVHVKGTRLGVTAVLPVYNGRRFLGHALASVVAQTEPPDELIIVDDGSSDGGVETIDRSTAPFAVRVVRQDRAGQSAARNRAVESARGDLIAFLDQDDAWHPDHLAALCAPLRDDPAVGWVYSDFDEIDGEGRTVTLSFLREHRVAHPRSSLTACVSEDLMVIPSASVIRRRTLESLGGFDEMLSGFEDDDLFVRAFRSGWRFVFDDRSLTSFRVHGSSSSANGRFAESRRYFSTKLQEAVADDRRLNRYYFRDVIAPRFFRSSLDDYVRAVSERDWDTAARAWADLYHFAGFRRDHATLRWKTAIIRNPRRFRRMLRINGALPRSLRPAKNPALSLR